MIVGRKAGYILQGYFPLGDGRGLQGDYLNSAGQVVPYSQV